MCDRWFRLHRFLACQEALAERLSRPCYSQELRYLHSILYVGFISSYLIRACVSTAGDDSKVGHLRSLPGADARLSLFESDLYSAETFEPAIRGCEYVFLVATPLQHSPNSQVRELSSLSRERERERERERKTHASNSNTHVCFV